MLMLMLIYDADVDVYADGDVDVDVRVGVHVAGGVDSDVGADVDVDVEALIGRRVDARSRKQTKTVYCPVLEHKTIPENKKVYVPSRRQLQRMPH